MAEDYKSELEVVRDKARAEAEQTGEVAAHAFNLGFEACAILVEKGILYGSTPRFREEFGFDFARMTPREEPVYKADTEITTTPLSAEIMAGLIAQKEERDAQRRRDMTLGSDPCHSEEL